MTTNGPRICLGIDPGIGRMGWGVVYQLGPDFRALRYGCLETPPKTPTERRLLALYEGISEVIVSCSPHFMSIEKLYFGQNRTTAEAVWQARGVALLAAAQHGMAVLEPKPADVKLSVCGDVHAVKTQMQTMVRLLLGLRETPKPDDTADALAIAMTGLTMYQYERGWVR